MSLLKYLLLLVISMSAFTGVAQNNALVFQSDFGLKDGAVGAMKGVAFGVSPNLKIYDITHEIPPYNIWEASYRLYQTVAYWPAGTVFVSIIDPGVGSNRRSVVAKTRSGHFIVTPDNGTLTLVAESLGIEALREIDESKNRLSNSGQSYTFHGRDVYAFTGARLSSGVIRFEEVGPLINGDVARIPYQKPQLKDGMVRGNIPVLDVQYGNVWTNIDTKTLAGLHVNKGELVSVKIFQKEKLVYAEDVPLTNTFSEVPEGNDVAYLNSLLNFSLGINMGNFADKYRVQSGPEWTIEIQKGK